MNQSFSWLVVSTFICFATGCGQSSATGSSSDSQTLPPGSSKYVLSQEPDGAVGVIEARTDSKDGDEIVLLGRIGGRKDPWIRGLAAFVVIDAAMLVVGDGEESSKNEVCMDDCCASLRTECTTLVKIVDHQGKPLAIDARKLLDASENDLVVIKGHVQRGEEGNFSVAANGVYVRR